MLDLFQFQRTLVSVRAVDAVYILGLRRRDLSLNVWHMICDGSEGASISRIFSQLPGVNAPFRALERASCLMIDGDIYVIGGRADLFNENETSTYHQGPHCFIRRISTLSPVAWEDVYTLPYNVTECASAGFVDEADQPLLLLCGGAQGGDVWGYAVNIGDTSDSYPLFPPPDAGMGFRPTFCGSATNHTYFVLDLEQRINGCFGSYVYDCRRREWSPRVEHPYPHDLKGGFVVFDLILYVFDSEDMVLHRYHIVEPLNCLPSVDLSHLTCLINYHGNVKLFAFPSGHYWILWESPSAREGKTLLSYCKVSIDARTLAATMKEYRAFNIFCDSILSIVSDVRFI